jgi:hypothetical protein
MQQEAASLRACLPGLLDVMASASLVEAGWLARTLTDVILGAQALLPEEDFTLALLEVAAAAGEPGRASA